jgi:hypothetical protein
MNTDSKKTETEQCTIPSVSKSSRKTILQCLNNSLKYGKRLLVDCDDDDEQGQIDLWRTNQEIEQAIKEVENCG